MTRHLRQVRGKQRLISVLSAILLSAAVPAAAGADQANVLSACLDGTGIQVRNETADLNPTYRDAVGRGYAAAEIFSIASETFAPEGLSNAGAHLAAFAIGPVNRWKLVPALIVYQSENGARLLQQDRLQRGQAIYMPKQTAGACADQLRQAEMKARRSELGIWGEGNSPPVYAAAGLQRLVAAAGQYGIVRGRIVSLGKTRSTRYLNFGRYWKKDFTVTLASQDADIVLAGLRRKGWSFEDLDGQPVEIRGVIEVQDGPLITWSLPEQLIVLEEKRAGRDGQNQN
ncbi:hypothetical protein [Roseibium sp.]|uniref:hypothetical protein n=1 Tax=Roseibium sp. TaxID=1936156 RepID=UPI003B5198C7